MSKVIVEYPEGAAQGVSQVSKGIKIQLDDNVIITEILLEDNLASNVADSILHALGELTSEELKDKILSLEARVEELEGIVGDYEQNDDIYREKLRESCYPL